MIDLAGEGDSVVYTVSKAVIGFREFHQFNQATGLLGKLYI